LIKSQQNKVGGWTIRSKVHKHINSICKNEWKESINVPIYKKEAKTDCSNYRDISLLPTTYKILSNILLSKLDPYAEEIIVDHQCRLRRNRSNY